LINFVQKHFNDYERYQAFITDMDSSALEKHNFKYLTGSPYHLYKSMNPCPFEGDLANTRVILLLANPGINGEDTRPDNHCISAPGYGLKNLSPDCESDWYRKRFKTLLDRHTEDDWKWLSHRMAMVQIVPWASKRWMNVDLPSRELMIQTVQYVAKVNPGALFVVMRQQKFWTVTLDGHAEYIVHHRPRNSYITERNFGSKSFRLIKERIYS
jgi:hypothetical protein